MSGVSTTPPIGRFTSHTEWQGDCLVWTAALFHNGYGAFHDWPVRRKVKAHRWIYEFYRGPIPPGLFVDHLCRNRACVRLDHMEVVTFTENLRRGHISRRKEAAHA